MKDVQENTKPIKVVHAEKKEPVKEDDTEREKENLCQLNHGPVSCGKYMNKEIRDLADNYANSYHLCNHFVIGDHKIFRDVFKPQLKKKFA